MRSCTDCALADLTELAEGEYRIRCHASRVLGETAGSEKLIRWAGNCKKFLAKRGMTPQQISQARREVF